MKCNRRGCTGDTVDGKTMCNVHLESHKEAQKRYRIKRTAECGSGQEDGGESPPSVAKRTKLQHPTKAVTSSMEENSTTSRALGTSHSARAEGSTAGELGLTVSVTDSGSVERSALNEREVLEEVITEWSEDIVTADGKTAKAKKIARRVEKGKRVEQDSGTLQTSASARVQLLKSSYDAKIAIAESNYQAFLERQQEEREQALLYEMLHADDSDEESETEEVEYDSEEEIQRQKEERAAKRRRRSERFREESVVVYIEPGEPIPEEHPDDAILPHDPVKLFEKQYWERNKDKYREGTTAEILWLSLPRDERVYPEHPRDVALYKSTYSAAQYGKSVSENRLRNGKRTRTCFVKHRSNPDAVVAVIESEWDSPLWGNSVTANPEVMTLSWRKGVLDPSLVPRDMWDRHLLQCWLDRDNITATAHLDPTLVSVDSVVVHAVTRARHAALDALDVLAGARVAEDRVMRVEYAMCRFEGVTQAVPVLVDFIKLNPRWRRKLPTDHVATRPIPPSTLREKPLWTYLLK